MREFFEFAGLVVGIAIVFLAIVAVVLGIVSLPVALIGWVILTVINLFVPTATSYLIYVAVGIATSLLINLIRVIAK